MKKKETIASIKKELESERAARREVREERDTLSRWMDKIGVILYDNGVNLAYMDRKTSFSLAEVVGMAAKSASSVHSLRDDLAHERERVRDILDRFAPHKERLNTEVLGTRSHP